MVPNSSWMPVDTPYTFKSVKSWKKMWPLTIAERDSFPYNECMPAVLLAGARETIARQHMKNYRHIVPACCSAHLIQVSIYILYCPRSILHQQPMWGFIGAPSW